MKESKLVDNLPKGTPGKGVLFCKDEKELEGVGESPKLAIRWAGGRGGGTYQETRFPLFTEKLK